MKKLFLFILIFGTALILRAQDPMVQQTVEDLLESTGENMSDDTNFQEILDDLIRFRQNPLKINSASGDELLSLHLLSSLQIDNLISFRQKTGTIYSIYEMASIEDFTPDVLQRIEPFISFEEQNPDVRRKKSATDLFLRSSRSFSSEINPETSNYEGSFERYYLRLRHESADLEYGLVAEKDPGESFFRLSNKQGFDYYSAFVNFRLGKADNRLFAGDYSVRFGQGLVAWQGFSMGKSSETTQVFRAAQGIRSYSSTDENQFFRGFAGQFGYRRFVFSPFISLNRVDAHVDTLDGKAYFGAFQTSGYHRTESEISGENAVTQFTAGGHVSYTYERWVFGVTTVFNRFNTEMIRDDAPYNQFLPDGKENVVAGFDWKGSVSKIYFFGEAALSAYSGKALLAGIMLKPAPNAELSMVYRSINKTYFSYFSNAFTESSRINDEHSMYLGLKFFPAAHWNVFGYVDFFRNKWIKYTTAAPSIGTELLSQVSFNPTRKTSFYLRFFQEEKDQKLVLERLKYNEIQVINRIRLNYEQVLNEQFSMKSRVELSFYSKENSEKGFLIFQDMVYKPVERPFALNGRLAYFKTDGYDSRLYAYENDVLYSFSVPALYGNGIRSYLNFQYKFSANLQAWLKFASTHQFNQSDGIQTIGSSTRSELKIQLRYQF
jgi:hypothetical protein